MKLSFKILIIIFVGLVILNGLWAIYEIKQELQFNKDFNQQSLSLTRNTLEKILFQIQVLQLEDRVLYSTINVKSQRLDNKIIDLKIEDKLIYYTIDGDYNKLDKKIEGVTEKAKKLKIQTEQILKQVNVVIVNKTIGALGSGVSIKYKDNFYILTAGHLINNITDELYLYENKNEVCKLEIVKAFIPDTENVTATTDLLLVKPINNDVKPRFYTELADKEPITGTQVYIVGNPMSIEDVVSDGRVIFYKENFMYYIDHTYFGNSGGGVYTLDGKLLGIVSHMSNLKPMEDAPDYVISGAVRIDSILEFLKGV